MVINEYQKVFNYKYFNGWFAGLLKQEIRWESWISIDPAFKIAVWIILIELSIEGVFFAPTHAIIPKARRDWMYDILISLASMIPLNSQNA